MIDSNMLDYQWLCSPEGREHLQAISWEDSLSPSVVQRLRRQIGTERTRLVVEQLELRQRGQRKFTRANQMFFTARLLEQATDEQIAAYKAGRFPRSGLVADLCCGLGGDLLAFGRHGQAIGIDRSALSAQLARCNCRAAGLSHVEAAVADVRSIDVSVCHAWHIDPDRRPGGHRTSRLDFSEPGLDAIARLLDQQPNGAIKLAPAAIIPEQWKQAAEREWIGSRRECRQQVAWLGSLATAAGLHTATVVSAAGKDTSLTGRGDEPVQVAERLGSYFCEPHAAVLAARLTQTLAQTYNLAAVSSGVPYLTGDHPTRTPLAADFAVMEEMPFDRRRLRSWLNVRRIGRAEIKIRGLQLDPQSLSGQLKLDGDEAATILIYRGDRQARAVVAQRIVAPVSEI